MKCKERESPKQEVSDPKQEVSDLKQEVSDLKKSLEKHIRVFEHCLAEPPIYREGDVVGVYTIEGLVRHEVLPVRCSVYEDFRYHTEYKPFYFYSVIDNNGIRSEVEERKLKEIQAHGEQLMAEIMKDLKQADKELFATKTDKDGTQQKTTPDMVEKVDGKNIRPEQEQGGDSQPEKH